MTFLVLDLGSSSVRALWMDAQGRMLPDAIWSRPLAFETDDTGMSQVDGHRVRRLIEACIDDALAHPAARSVSAVGMATFVGNLVGLDSSGQPATPVYTYADTRAVHDARALAGEVDARAAHQRTGCRIHSAYHPARLAWLRRTDPNLFGRVALWADLGAYLLGCWTGERVCSPSAASWSGLLNRETLNWDAAWLAHFGLDDAHFPRLADITQPVIGLADEYRARWPALADIPFFPALGDGAAANVGMGAVTADTLAVSIGTTAAVRMLFALDELPDVPPALWSYRLDRRHHLLGGATTEGGSVYAWLAGLLGRETVAHAEADLRARPLDAHGLTVLPMLGGERSPGWRADATATIHGLRAATTPSDIVAAALESVVLRLAEIAAHLPPANGPVMAGGGALTASPLWARCLCAAMARPVHVVAEPETTARGLALLLAHVLDGQALDAFPPAVGHTCLPDADDVARMRDARVRQASLYRALYP
jgi:gluconokinase